MEVLGKDKKGRPVVQGAMVEVSLPIRSGRRLKKMRRLSGIVIGSWEGELVILIDLKGDRGIFCFSRSSRVKVVRYPETD